jgi:hypothetical protein
MEMMGKSKTMWKICLVKIHHSSTEATNLLPKDKEDHNLDKVESAEAKLLGQEVTFLALVQTLLMEGG